MAALPGAARAVGLRFVGVRTATVTRCRDRRRSRGSRREARARVCSCAVRVESLKKSCQGVTRPRSELRADGRRAMPTNGGKRIMDVPEQPLLDSGDGGSGSEREVVQRQNSLEPTVRVDHQKATHLALTHQVLGLHE